MTHTLPTPIRGRRHYEKVVDQMRADGVTDAEIAQAVADAPGMISPNNLPPLARGQRRAAAELAEHAAEIRRLGKQVVEDVIEIGARLSECRAILKDDRGWRAWLKHELRLSPQSAGRFIQVHKLAQERSNLERVDLPVSALYLLAAPSTPEAAKTEVIARAEAGEVLSVSGVRGVIESKEPATGKKRTKRKPAYEIDGRPATPAEFAKSMAKGFAEDDAEVIGNDVDPAKSAEARKAAYAAAEDDPAKPAAKPKALSKHEKKGRCKVANYAATVLDGLDLLVAHIDEHPDWFVEVDLDQFSEQLRTKVSVFLDLAQRARRRGGRAGGGQS
jgi:Protein of unknown function (DUF3102)